MWRGIFGKKALLHAPPPPPLLRRPERLFNFLRCLSSSSSAVPKGLSAIRSSEGRAKKPNGFMAQMRTDGRTEDLFSSWPSHSIAASSVMENQVADPGWLAARVADFLWKCATHCHPFFPLKPAAQLSKSAPSKVWFSGCKRNLFKISTRDCRYLIFSRPRNRAAQSGLTLDRDMHS